ncbi:hypothetical protein O988_09583 [Pseudogymnoascus sp. VKM F-3808]|nr:hypothetical protein O988_09583 [Pseudogymnoascus sp. VKM F-3808]
MTVSINELVTGISGQDILSELRHEEVTGGAPQAGGILARLPKYIIEQRHFFPLYPPVDRKLLLRSGTAEGVPPGAMLDRAAAVCKGCGERVGDQSRGGGEEEGARDVCEGGGWGGGVDGGRAGSGDDGRA